MATKFIVGEGYRIGSGCVIVHVDVDLVDADAGGAGEACQNVAAKIADLDVVVGGAGGVEEQAGATG